MKERSAAGRSLELREKPLDKLFSVAHYSFFLKN